MSVEETKTLVRQVGGLDAVISELTTMRQTLIARVLEINPPDYLLTVFGFEKGEHLRGSPEFRRFLPSDYIKLHIGECYEITLKRMYMDDSLETQVEVELVACFAKDRKYTAVIPIRIADEMRIKKESK